MLNHEELQSLVAGYVLSALDPEDWKAFERHLATCASCQQLVAELAPVANTLPLLAEDAAPPPHLKERVLQAARQDRAGKASPRADGFLPLPRLWRTFTHLKVTAPAIFILLLAVAGLAFWTAQLQNDVANTEIRLAKTYQGIAIMGQANRWWPIRGSDQAPSAVGTLAYSEEQSAACLLIWNLPQVKGRSYQAWTISKGAPTSAGVMWRVESGVWIIIPGALDRADTVAVTLEKAGGSAQPEGPVVVTVSIGSKP